MSFCLYDKKNIRRRLEDMNFIFSWPNQYFTHSLRSFVKYCFATQFAPPCNILYTSVYIFTYFFTFLTDTTTPSPTPGNNNDDDDEIIVVTIVVIILEANYLALQAWSKGRTRTTMNYYSCGNCPETYI